ncbi:helix-turn-helix transcriptional regulator [Aurantimonas sp. C2-6-R+9]|uniref:helix-turn-helix domain-containing protein n=1 Tax=unclassified Aurantimonas TaxID=2638230 RepID=UPI002E176651|nr:MULTISPECIES: helix-turn-helix transcriptional regulator [unclassified Aurantimonas]MEC5292142.1 helix-turn-helix transcriptional regulator [Aurantimonas sp. C2-3-R2]MEC5383592.1 helix-turn-helix transcriptional regulator [Aurantimonas sp. C2-6-R+9]MEC5413229.1 helix-turn-helix transcriptional regulator [Aurantimonas sp. C2-4-R8]
MAELNPEILKWARQTAGLDLETAARKIGLNAARGVPGADRLASYETGNSRPSMSLLRRMAPQYHRPLLTFYLPKVPAPAELGQDFRTLPDQGSPSNVLLATLLRDVKARQALVRATIEDDEDATAVTLVDSQRGVTDPLRLSVALVAAIGFDRAEFRSHQSAEDAFAYLRARVEAVGVFVLLAGDCGSWQTAIEVSIFRGFAITDDLAPFLVINDQDAKAAWSFTLLHELAHLLLGEPGISGGAPTAGIEQLCNDAAAATLITPDELADLSLEGGAGDIVAIGELADRCRVSRGMVAYQLFRAKRLPLRRWEELRDRFREEWLAKKAATRAANRESPGGPNWYVLRRHRLGAALLDIAREGIADGSLTPTRAARMLGVKPMSVYPLLAGTGRRRITT